MSILSYQFMQYALIAAIITERGIARPPYDGSLRSLFEPERG